jgi:hypothetical protein
MQIQAFTGMHGALMNECRLIHRHQPCQMHYGTWLEDHPANNQNMAQAYADATESEAEAEARLSGDEESGWDTSVYPASSQ